MLRRDWFAIFDFITLKQNKFLRRMWPERSEMQDDPLTLTIRVTLTSRVPTGRCVDTFISTEPPKMSISIENVCTDS